MKLAGVFLMLGLVGLTVYASSQTLNFSGRDIPLKDVFKIIKCQTGVVFFYDCALLRDAKPVTVKWENTKMEKALDECFKNQSVTWALEGKTVTVIKRQPQVVARAEVQHFP